MVLEVIGTGTTADFVAAVAVIDNVRSSMLITRAIVY